MAALSLRPKSECRWDLLALGEVMLRLDPGENRIATARTFRAWEGGGEYNVARGLKRCFGLDTAVVTALADNPIGRLIEGRCVQPVKQWSARTLPRQSPQPILGRARSGGGAPAAAERFDKALNGCTSGP